MKSKLKIYKNGDKYWKLPNGKLHREDGPAFIRIVNDYKAWYINNKLHREDGPAVEMGHFKEWYLNDKIYTEEEHKKKMRLEKLKQILD